MKPFLEPLGKMPCVQVEQFVIRYEEKVNPIGGFTIALLDDGETGLVCGLHIELDDKKERARLLYHARMALMRLYPQVRSWHGYRAKHQRYITFDRPHSQRV